MPNTTSNTPVDPANKITAVGGISDPASLFDGMSGGEVISWSSQSTGTVSDVTVDAEGYPIFNNVPQGGGEAVFSFNSESSDGAGDWSAPSTYTANLDEGFQILNVDGDNVVAHGQTDVVIACENAGIVEGKVYWGGIEQPILSWSDDLIEVGPCNSIGLVPGQDYDWEVWKPV